MNWNYEEKLIEYIAQAQSDSGLTDYVFEVCSEQIFVKKGTLNPNVIYVVVKFLSSTNTLNAVTQPIQLIISCEQNQIQASQIIFSKLVASHNFEAIIDDGTYIKQDYREPVVLSNFNEVSYGYRTIMYVSATLFIMEDVIDIPNIKIEVDGRRIEELDADELIDANNYFDEGNLGDVYSLVYAIKISELLAKMSSESVLGPIGLHLDGGPTAVDLSGRLIVDDIECASFNIITTECILKDVNGDTIETISFTGKDYLYIQLMPQYNDEYSNIYRIGGADYYKIFPDIVKRKCVGLQTIENVKPINFNMVYSMSPNTQPILPDRIATSVKSVATFAVSFAVPLVSTYSFIEAISNIMAGIISGNVDFIVSFTLGSVEFKNIHMKLTNSQITTAINQVPGLQIGLIK